SAEEGTGIGLVMCKVLVELMGGRIGVESIPGAGCEFWFELGSAQVPRLAEEGAGPVPGAAPTVSADTAPRTLLYVEDNSANLALVEQLIERRPDLRLISAGTGIQGIELARLHHPEVILMDINLPGMSGIQALLRLREDPATAGIPVMAISANAMLSDVQKGLALGFFRYLTKPINVTEFMEALDLALAIGPDRGLGTVG
ncbi:MAG: response regulator, partial [Holophaga sp.]|nr:response regulator [Holophaga sp.]